MCSSNNKELARKLAIWAWGKIVPIELTEFEKWILRGIEEVSNE